MAIVDGLSWVLLRRIAAAVAVVATSSLAVKFYRHRRYFQSLQAQGMPMPPHSFFFGHIPAMIKVLMKYPQDLTGMVISELVRREFPQLGDFYYIDMWPLSSPMLVLADRHMLLQVQAASWPKPTNMAFEMKPITRGHDLFSLEGSEWRWWRSALSPAFSMRKMTQMIPAIIEELVVFADILRAHATKGDIFQLEPLSSKAAVDVIGRAAYGIRLNTLTGDNPMVHALERQMRLSYFILSPDKYAVAWNPLRPLLIWYNNWVMDSWLEPILKKRYDTLGLEEDHVFIDTVLDVLKKQAEKGGTPLTQLSGKPMQVTLGHLKLLLVAGEDTTRSIISYLYTLLHKHPEVCARVCAEHDEVLGTDFTKTAEMLTVDPNLVNKLPYTLAVIKEGLRLYPPVSGVKAGGPNLFLTDKNGKQYPTENCFIFIGAAQLQRNPDLWPRSTEFLPERWLAPADDPLHPPTGAWRAFEIGPRACIGQELAIMELKLILALTIREFDLQECYKEWDATHGIDHSKRSTWDDQFDYPVDNRFATAPKDGYPCRAVFRNKAVSN